MAKIEYFLQGFSDKNHIHLIKEFLLIPDIKKIVISVAYMNSDGICELLEEFEPYNHCIDIYVGIRNSVTSIQAISYLIHRNIYPFLVDTGASDFIFHPKIYFAYSDTEAKIIIGSANTTTGGLWRNIESSVVINLNRREEKDEKLLENIIKSFNGLVNDYPSNVKRVDDIKKAIQSYREGLLADERKQKYPNSKLKSKSKNSDSVPRMKLKSHKYIKSNSEKIEHIDNLYKSIKKDKWKLVWKSKPLKRTHLNIKRGENTHNKSNLSLAKGKFKGIDVKTYFRNEVFGNLKWELGINSKSHLEKTKANFEIIIKGIRYGIYKLELSHNTLIDSKTAKEKNYMTTIKWGKAMNLIRNSSLLGHSVYIYKPNDKTPYYIIEII